MLPEEKKKFVKFSIVFRKNTYLYDKYSFKNKRVTYQINIAVSDW